MEQSPIENNYNKLRNSVMLACGLSIPEYDTRAAIPILKFMDAHASDHINLGKSMALSSDQDTMLAKISSGESSEPLRKALAYIVTNWETKSVHWLAVELKRLHGIVNSVNPQS